MRTGTTNRIKGLGKVDSNFGISGWTANSQIRIGRGLQRTEARADDKGGTTEAAKGAIYTGRPHHQGANAIETQAEDEDGLVTPVPEYPVGIAQAGQGVSTKIGGLETRRPGPSNAQSVLEVLIEGIEETIGKAPEEEENGDNAQGPQGLAQGELCGDGNVGVFVAQGGLSSQ